MRFFDSYGRRIEKISQEVTRITDSFVMEVRDKTCELLYFDGRFEQG